ncbi:hypothetical protein GGS26DRAFT_370765 [Hypomontagnella submonticulosa]|nr:hypothetical protein GGS26DRAFT_370765 [Hypomontagnella submonticulosa]
MQISSVLLLSLFGSALSLVVPDTSDPQLSSRDDSFSASTRNLDAVESTLKARGSPMLRTEPISETQTLNIAMGAVLSVEQLRWAHGSPVTPWQQTIGNDIDSLGYKAGTQNPTRSGEIIHQGSIYTFKLTWTTSGYERGTVRLMSPEWQTLLQAAYRGMAKNQANAVEVYMNIESTAGWDIKLTVS